MSLLPDSSNELQPPTRPIDLVLGRLEGVRRSGAGWMSRCPAHDDRSPSLSVREADDQSVLVHCFKGCNAAEIVHAINLSLRDLFVRRGLGVPPPPLPTLREKVERELDRDARLGLRPPLQSRHLRAVDLEFTYPMPWYESAPHSDDPRWLTCIDRAIDEELFEFIAGCVHADLTPIRIPIRAYIVHRCEQSVALADRVKLRAAKLLRSMS